MVGGAVGLVVGVVIIQLVISRARRERRRAMKALVYGGPGRRRWGDVAEPEIRDPRTPSCASTP